MAISKEQLNKIIMGPARELCNPNGAAQTAKPKSIGDIDPSKYDNEADRWDAMYLSEDVERSGDMVYNENSAEKSAMPDFIKKSMLENKIDVTPLGGGSVLDTVGIPKPAKREVVTEQNVITSKPIPATNASTSVDYSIIKAVVNECLREYFKENSLLTEGATLKTIGLEAGNISIVDSKGNIFKAKLEKVGNKNDK